jgi:predicted nucleotidyltransferase
VISLLTRAEAARRIGVSVGAFDRHIRPAIGLVLVGRRVLVPEDEIERWVARAKAGRSSPPPDARAFLTGSRCYGEPREDSDVDVVVRCDHELGLLLRRFADPTPPVGDGDGDGDEYGGHVALRFGALNLILCYDDESFETWREGTDALLAEHFNDWKPITRERAIEEFKKRRGARARKALDL